MPWGLLLGAGALAPIVFAPDGKTAYIYCSDIQPINVATNTLDMPIALPVDLDHVDVPTMVITPNGRSAFITGYHLVLGPAYKVLSAFAAVFQIPLSR